MSSAKQPLVLTRDEVAAILPIISRIKDGLGNERSRAIIMYGPPGTGKTTLVLKDMKAGLSAMYNEDIPVYKVAMNPDMQASDIYGGYAPDDNGTWKFTPGPMLHAWGVTGKPGILLLDDIHQTGPGGTAAMYTALDSGMGGTFTMPDGRSVVPDVKYRAVATMNGSPDDLDFAVRDRLAITIPIMVPSTEMLAALDDRLREFVEADYDGTRPVQVATYRQWQTMNDLWPVVGIGKACLLALGDVDRARKMLQVLATDPDIPEAATEMMALVSGMKSGI